MRRIVCGLLTLSVFGSVPGAARPPLPDAPARLLDLDRRGCAHPNHVLFGPGGRVVVVAGRAGMEDGAVLTAWEPATGRHLWTVGGPDAPNGAADRADFSPDGKVLAVPASAARAVVLRGAADGREVRRLDCPGVFAVRCSPDGAHLAAMVEKPDGGGYGVRVLDVRTGRVGYEPVLAKNEVPASFDFVADGRLFFVSSLGQLRVWNPRGDPERVVPLDTDFNAWYSVDAAGTRLVGGSFPNECVTVRSFDLATGRVLCRFGPPGGLKGQAVLSRDGSEVVGISKDGRVVAWDAATGEPRAAFQVVAGEKDDLGLYGRGAVLGRFVVGRCVCPTPGLACDLSVSVYTRTGRLVREDAGVWYVVFDPTTRWVAVLSTARATADRPARTTVTIHDAAAWLAGGAKN